MLFGAFMKDMGSAFAGAQNKGRLSQVADFTIYYGHPTAQAMRELSAKQLAVLEPTAYTSGQIGALRAAGTIVIGYISVMEAPTWNVYRQERLHEDDYLRMGGERVHFAQWDSYLMDLRRPGYRALLLEEIGYSIAAKGLDGIFLDTVGDIDDYIRDPGLQAELRQAYKQLLQDVVRLHPGLVLLQNRGFDSLDAAFPYLHGIVWENWSSGWERDAWSKERVMRLSKEQKKGLRVFTVSHNSDPANARAAGKLSFVHLSAPNGFTDTVS